MRLISMTVIGVSLFMLAQGCAMESKRRLGLVGTGAGAGYFVGNQRDTETAVLGAVGGATAALITDKLYSGDYGNGYTEGFNDGLRLGEIKGIRRFQKEEDQGLYGLEGM